MSNEQTKVQPVETKSLEELRLNERWLQERIAEKPEILGLAGNMRLVERERRQPPGGRLDLLLEDKSIDRRYEVEIQLKATDERHIIHTIEYWDVERKRYPYYDHCAVIVAEEITGRFFNVIGLFNGHIPLIAIKLTAIKYPSGKVGLLFTRVLDEVLPGREEVEASSRDTWEQEHESEWVEFAETLFHSMRPGSAEKEPHYTNSYMAMQKGGKNVLLLKYSRNAVRVEILGYPAPNSELEEQLGSAGVAAEHYPQPKYRHYRFFVPLTAASTLPQLPAAMERILEGNNLGEQE